MTKKLNLTHWFSFRRAEPQGAGPGRTVLTGRSQTHQQPQILVLPGTTVWAPTVFCSVVQVAH